MPARMNHPSPLTAADSAFRLLTQGPAPLSLDGSRVNGTLPRRLIPLDELKRILLRPSTGMATRDSAWAELVTRARDEDPAWVIGAVGVAMPALRRVAGQLTRGYDIHTAADIDAEILTGFLAAVRALDLSRQAIALRLRWAAYRAGAAYRAKATSQPPPSEDPTLDLTAPQPSGHPDLVLADAIARGVLSPEEAELIGTTRLESVPLTAAARRLDVGYDAARMRRSRAEARLVSAIRAGDLS